MAGLGNLASGISEYECQLKEQVSYSGLLGAELAVWAGHHEVLVSEHQNGL